MSNNSTSLTVPQKRVITSYFVSGVLCALSALILSMSMGMNAILFPTTMERLGFDTSLIGAVLSGELAATLTICFGLSRFLSWMNVAIAVFLSTVLRIPCLLALGFLSTLTPDFLTSQWIFWVILVFLHGLGAYTSLLIIQTWINSLPIGKNKGLLTAMFGTSISIGFAAGPILVEHSQLLYSLVSFMLPLTENQQHGLPFLISLGLSSLMILPLIGAKRPSFELSDSGNILGIIRRSPPVMLAVSTAGVTFFGVTSFITIYGLGNNLDLYHASLLLTAFMLGCIVLEAPAAWLSEHFDRRYILMLVLILGLICSAYLPIAIESSFAWILMFLWGGVNAAVYSIALTIVGEKFRCESEIVPANAAYSLMDSVGGVVGVVAIGLAMNVFGFDGMPYVIMLSCLVYLSYALTRYRVV